MTVAVGVVILDLDQSRITARCLRSLTRGSRIPDVVVLVENGSEAFNNPKDEALAALNLVRLRPGRNLGCAGGRNLGLDFLVKNTSVRTLVVLDNDTVVPHEFVERVADLALTRLEVAAPVIRELATKQVWSCGGKIAPDGSIEQLTWRGTDPHGRTVVDWAPGACLILSRETWDAVGGFDSWLNFLFEDIEWCLRVRRAGGRVVVHGGLQVFHEPHQSLGGRWSQARVRLWARNGTLFRFTSVQPGPVAIARWLGSEVLLAARDLASGRATWCTARLRGLAEGLRESGRRRTMGVRFQEQRGRDVPCDFPIPTGSACDASRRRHQGVRSSPE